MPKIDFSRKEIELILEVLEAHKKAINEFMEVEDPDWQRDLAETNRLIERLLKEIIQEENNG